MRLRLILASLAGASFFGGIASAYITRETWLAWVTPASSASKHGPVGEVPPVKLSAQAQANLRLEVKPLQVGTYWRTIQVPGLIVERPAQSDRGIVAPVTGVVTRVHRFPGDIVKPDEVLFTLRLLSETLHLAQSELFKTNKEIEITQERKEQLAPLYESVNPGAKMVEIDNQLRRLAVADLAYRTELLTRGLTPEQIKLVAKGTFVFEIEIKTPKYRNSDSKLLAGLLAKRLAVRLDDGEPSFEVQDLKVDLGQQVQAGQTMCLLSNHQSLFIEGRAFSQETPLLEKSAKEGWPMQVEFMEEKASGWPALEQTFTIRHIANTIDTASGTFAFYIPLKNQSRSFEKDDKTLMLWRFRPGQKVRLLVRVEKLENVFVLPADAVVREGPEAFVFRQNGDLFDRKPVHVVYQDRQHAVVANDGSISPEVFVAQNGATQINRVLKSGSGSPSTGGHMHADGSIHSNSDHK